MKSPIQESINNFCSLKTLKKIIPKGSVVSSFLFFDGKQELSLSEDKRIVIAHTNKYTIYEFWYCAMRDPTRIALMAEELFKDLRDENLFALLQENWHTYKDPYIRSALFFLLNRCSENGLISAGKLDDKRYNPISLSYLKKFKMDNFHIKWDQQDDFVKTFGDIKNTDYLLFPIGKFNYNLFEYGKNKGYEMTTIHHKRFYEALQDVKDKWIVLYKNHPHVHILYKEHNIIMLDKYGREIKDKEKCEEMVIANF